MKEFLTDLEVAKIEAFCKDTEMHDAVKKVLLQALFTHGTVNKEYTPDPLRNGAFGLAALALSNPIPDAEIGAHVRAMFSGVNVLNNAFEELNTIKTPKADPVESPYNVAE